MTSLMTSQRPDPLSVRINNFPVVLDHRVKKSAQSDKNSRRRSILKTRTDILTDILTSGQIDAKLILRVAKAERSRTNYSASTLDSKLAR